MSKQILRSGTSIGAMSREAQYAESKADFVHKLTIGLKEANETEYWLFLLNKTDYLSNEQFESLYGSNIELLKLLISIINSTKKKIKDNG